MTPQEIRDFAKMIELTEREGADRDVPEGTRTVTLKLSDTFAQKVVAGLNEAADTLDGQP